MYIIMESSQKSQRWCISASKYCSSAFLWPWSLSESKVHSFGIEIRGHREPCMIEGFLLIEAVLVRLLGGNWSSSKSISLFNILHFVQQFKGRLWNLFFSLFTWPSFFFCLFFFLRETIGKILLVNFSANTSTWLIVWAASYGLLSSSMRTTRESEACETWLEHSGAEWGNEGWMGICHMLLGVSWLKP